jgi:hypothetical protein
MSEDEAEMYALQRTSSTPLITVAETGVGVQKIQAQVYF